MRGCGGEGSCGGALTKGLGGFVRLRKDTFRAAGIALYCEGGAFGDSLAETTCLGSW